MANQSIYAAFERMWQHMVAKFNEVAQPKPLTIKGAVEAIYDGSAAVDVEIPDASQNAKLVTVCDLTLEEEVSIIDIDKDINGNPFALTEVFFEAKFVPNEATQTSTFVQLRYANPAVPNGFRAIVQPVGGGVTATKDVYVKAHAMLNNGTWQTMSFKYKDSYLVVDATAYSDLRVVKDGAMNDIPAQSLQVYTTTNLGVGSRIYIYGR